MSQLILDLSAVGSNNQWANIVGGYTKPQAVARPDNDSTNYLGRFWADTGTGRQSFTSATTRGIPTNATINSLLVNARCLASGSENYLTFVVSGGITSGPGTLVSATTAWTNGSASQTQVAWTPALVNDGSLEIGIQKLSWTGGDTSFIYCTTLYATVNFTLPSPTATTNAADNTTASGARLNGAVNPNGATSQYPISYYFEYGPTVAYGTTTTPANGTGSSNIPVATSITGLTGNTTYHFRMVAKTADATINGSDMTFTTGIGDKILMVL